MSIMSLAKAHVRYEGTDFSLPVPLGSASDIQQKFEQAHLKRYGYTQPGKPITLEKISIEAVTEAPLPPTSTFRSTGTNTASADVGPQPIRKEPADVGPQLIRKAPEDVPSQPVRKEPADVPPQPIRTYFRGAWLEAPVHDRSDLTANSVIDGPAMIIDPTSTLIVDNYWRAELLPSGMLRLHRLPGGTATTLSQEHHRADPILLEVFNNLFMFIAEQMGITLQNTSHSVNIKERLDFSCALFDGAGNLIANAPHIPVHLGSMGESVQEMIRQVGDRLRPGDVYALNDPYHGGTHLPDITVITPVFDDKGESILFFLASRGHHADVGGITPGSMPPASTSVLDEGILLNMVQIVNQGRFLE
jgi:5-oxoprolinase (ATP-hydrolysing)